MSSAPLSERQEFARRQGWCFAIAGVAGLVCAVGALLDLPGFFRSYLFAWLSWLSFPLGSLMIFMVHQLTGGRWGQALQPVLRASMGTLPLFAVLFVLIAVGIPDLYVWSDAERVAADETLRQKTVYLNVPRFVIFAVVYFAVWIGISWRLTWLQKRWQHTEDDTISRQARGLSAVGLVLMGLTVTFAAIDWIMSLEPHWFSSIFGMLIASAMVLPAFAFGVAVLAWRTNVPDATPIAAYTWNDLGNLLLALVMLWAYMSFSQYFLIWSGNLPEEITWYLQRTRGIWQWLAIAMILFYFLLPFFLLLVRDLKRNPQRLAGVAILIVVMHFVHQYWLIQPAFAKHDASEHGGFFQGMHWLDAPALLAVGGLWAGVFIHRLKHACVSRPLTDPSDREPTEETSDEN